MAFVVDLHVHTAVGSWDSSIRAPSLAARLRELPHLDGIVLAEHGGRWDADQLEQLGAETDAFVVNAREYDTDWGHVIVLGVPDRDVHGIRSAAEIRRVVSDVGGAMIAAHPFRYFPGPGSLLFPQSAKAWYGEGAVVPPIEELAAHPLFQLVDAIEVLNQGSTTAENNLALAVAAYLGKPGTGGSDAHEVYSIGRHATEFRARLRSERDLIDAILAGDCYGVRKRVEGYVRAGS